MLQLNHCLLWNTLAQLATLVYSTVDSGLTNLIHDRCSCTLFTLSSVSSKTYCVFISRLGGLESDISSRFAATSVSGLFMLGWMSTQA